MLQETYSLKEDEKVWSAEWGGQALFSHGSEHSRGVRILLKVGAACALNLAYPNPNGRYIVTKLSTGDEELFLSLTFERLITTLSKRISLEI